MQLYSLIIWNMFCYRHKTINWIYRRAEFTYFYLNIKMQKLTLINKNKILSTEKENVRCNRRSAIANLPWCRNKGSLLLCNFFLFNINIHTIDILCQSSSTFARYIWSISLNCRYRRELSEPSHLLPLPHW